MQPPTPQVADPIPVRMCNELVFCPRLYHLEHVQGIFVESAATIEGSAQHRRAARKPLYRQRSDAPSPWSADLPRTLHFTSEAWGVSGQLDMIELTTGEVVPVEAKRGSAPSHDEHRWRGHDLRYRAWPADVAQLGLYMALLRDAGLPCSEGRIFYRRNRTLVTIAWSRELELVLREVVAQAQSVHRHLSKTVRNALGARYMGSAFPTNISHFRGLGSLNSRRFAASFPAVTTGRSCMWRFPEPPFVNRARACLSAHAMTKTNASR